MTRFYVPGKVLGKPRPRFAKTGRVYTEKKFAQYERAIAAAYKAAGGQLLLGPVQVDILIHRTLPASRPKKVEAEADMVKPDVDNVAKIVLDALNGVAYKDDSQVIRLKVAKDKRRRAIKEHLEILVSPTC